jgi:hypothetical protein
MPAKKGRLDLSLDSNRDPTELFTLVKDICTSSNPGKIQADQFAYNVKVGEKTKETAKLAARSLTFRYLTCITREARSLSISKYCPYALVLCHSR